MALNRRMNPVKSNQNGNSLKLGFHYGLSEITWDNIWTYFFYHKLSQVETSFQNYLTKLPLIKSN